MNRRGFFGALATVVAAPLMPAPKPKVRLYGTYPCTFSPTKATRKFEMVAVVGDDVAKWMADAVDRRIAEAFKNEIARIA